jgi:hypothetical protein
MHHPGTPTELDARRIFIRVQHEFYVESLSAQRIPALCSTPAHPEPTCSKFLQAALLELSKPYHFATCSEKISSELEG